MIEAGSRFAFNVNLDRDHCPELASSDSSPGELQKPIRMTNFKVIVVGGGPAGITVAHLLSLAKIDFVLVEKRDTISTWTGAGLTLWPHGMRIFHQMGLMSVLEPIASKLVWVEAVGPGGISHAVHPNASQEK